MKKIIFITGSTDGIGKKTAIESAKKGAFVIIHGKTQERALKTVNDIKRETGTNDIDYVVADFTDLSSILNLHKKLKLEKVDILINNACTFQHSFKKTFDGFEYTFQICYLAHFILTDQLFPLIQKAENGRIINVSSMVHAHTLDLDFIKDAEKYDGYKAYEVSKLANVLFTYELAERIKNTNITVNCLHPGVISTKLLHNGWGIGGADVSVGADNLLFLAFSDKIKNVSGKYFANKKAVPSSPITYDKKIRTDFWKYTEKILNYKPQWM